MGSIAPPTTPTTPVQPAPPYEIQISTGPGPGFGIQNYDYNSIYAGNTFSAIDNLTKLHGRHTFKAGVEIRRIQLNQHYGEHGTVTFSSLNALAANQVKKASLTGALPVNDLRKNWFIGYVQDEFKVRPNFTLNLGARYTVFQLFHEAHGKANPFDFATCGPQGFCGVGASFGQQNYGDFDPRVALAWSPVQDRKTIVRAGFGTYHEDGQLDDQNLPAKNEIPSYSLTNVTYPVAPYLTGSGTLSPNAEQRDRKDTYVEQWNASVQRELPANLVGYDYLHGKPWRASAGNQRGEPDQSGYGDCAISGLCPRHWLARVDRRQLIQWPLRVCAAAVREWAPVGGKLRVYARDRQRLQWQRGWRRDIAAEPILLVLRVG